MPVSRPCVQATAAPALIAPTPSVTISGWMRQRWQIQPVAAAEHGGGEDDERDGRRPAPSVAPVELADDDRAHDDVARHREVEAAEDQHEGLPQRGEPEQRREDEHRVDRCLAR